MYVLLIVVCPFVLFLVAIVLSVLLRYMYSDCPFGIFKLFFIFMIYRSIVNLDNVFLPFHFLNEELHFTVSYVYSLISSDLDPGYRLYIPRHIVNTSDIGVGTTCRKRQY